MTTEQLLDNAIDYIYEFAGEEDWICEELLQIPEERVSLYPNENAQVLSNVYVEDRCRHIGICTEILNAIQCVLKRPYTIVYVDEWAPEYVRNMYRKRGYIVLNN